MNICVPVNEARGMQSSVCAHFGSAPAFLIVDVESESCRIVPNRNRHHQHGMCAPLASLAGEAIDGLVVGGMGMGALGKANAAGIRVYVAEHATVGEVVAAYRTGALRLMDPTMACAHHGHEHT